MKSHHVFHCNILVLLHLFKKPKLSVIDLRPIFRVNQFLFGTSIAVLEVRTRPKDWYWAVVFLTVAMKTTTTVQFLISMALEVFITDISSSLPYFALFSAKSGC